MSTTYCTLYRIGRWASLDAKCETEIEHYDAGPIINHTVHYALISKYGDVASMGMTIFSQFDPDNPTVTDEDGENHPNLDAAIRDYADWLVKLTPMPGRRVPEPPRHELYNSSTKTAFQRGREVPRE
jgi:hypothetical protein